MSKSYGKFAGKGRKVRPDQTRKNEMSYLDLAVGMSNVENVKYIPGKSKRKTACERDQELRKKGEENRQKKKQEAEKEKPPAPKPEPQKPKPKVIPDEESAKILKVEDIDFCIDNEAHHTADYECCEKRKNDQDEDCEPEPVIRRGANFTLKVKFDRPYKKDQDGLRLIFWTGYKPAVNTGTLANIGLDEPGKVQAGSEKWGATLIDNKPTENIVTLDISPPATCPIGEWQLKIRTFDMEKTKEENEAKKFCDFISGEPFSILFNPWCKEDSVYYEKTDDLKEYILNPNGLIFSGSQWSIGGKPWNYGQFEAGVLDAAFYLVRMGFDFKTGANMADPVRVARAISKTVNNIDDNGSLAGNWSGNYAGGKKPTEWAGSVKILKEYMRTGSPVKFGQCWVFSGVTTTVCRAIGIPARSVTNFSSAHDTNGDCTIDTNLDFFGDEKDSSDSVWNFHVWNDVWMTRPDLPPGYDGWQAIDATPQETSEGVFQCGPAPLKAVKNGECSIPYDTTFVFSEVNGDRVTWKDDFFGDPQPIQIKTNSVGFKISTKIADGKAFAPDTGTEHYRDDITNLYKYQEGTTEEREAVLRANQSATKRRDVYNIKTQDQFIKFRLLHPYDVPVGEPLQIKLTAKNQKKMSRTIDKAELKLYTCDYTGVKIDPQHPFKYVKFPEKSLDEDEEHEFVVNLTPEEYEQNLGEQGTIKIETVSTVAKRGFTPAEIKFKSHDFIFKAPDLVVKPKQTEVKVGDQLQVEISYTNPLHIPLTNVVLSFESCAFRPFTDVKIGTIKARTEYKNVFTLIPKCKGEPSLQFSLDSNELQDTKGTCCVCVKKQCTQSA